MCIRGEFVLKVLLRHSFLCLSSEMFKTTSKVKSLSSLILSLGRLASEQELYVDQELKEEHLRLVVSFPSFLPLHFIYFDVFWSFFFFHLLGFAVIELQTLPRSRNRDGEV